MFLLKRNNMKRKIIFLLIFLAIIIIGAIFYSGLKIDTQYTNKENVNFIVPDFSAKTLKNSKSDFTNHDIKSDRYSLLNIWASWCLPCRKEHKYLVKLSNFSEIDIYGINFKDKKENAIDFLNKSHDPYIINGVDKDGSLSIQLGIVGIPESILINQNKKIIKRYIGPLNKKTYKEIVDIIKN